MFSGFIGGAPFHVGERTALNALSGMKKKPARETGKDYTQQWMIQGMGLEVPGDAVQFFGNLARFGFAVNGLGSFGADAIHWRMSDFNKLVLAGCEVANLRKFAHCVCPFCGLVKGPKPLINSLRAPSSGRSTCVTYQLVAVWSSTLTVRIRTRRLPRSYRVPFCCQEHSGLPVTRFKLLKSKYYVLCLV
jgi:hypothetical protein